MTGRKFKCKGLKEGRMVNYWAKAFTIGREYEEEAKDIPGILNLRGDNGCTYFVNENQFELVKS